MLNFALYIYASTLESADKTFGQYLQMYAEKGSGFEILSADYWLKSALELPGAILTKIYPEHEKPNKQENQENQENQEKEIAVKVVHAVSFDFEGY